MPVPSAIGVSTSPMLIPAKMRNWCKERNSLFECRSSRVPMAFHPLSVARAQIKLPASDPVGMGLQLQPIDRRRKALSASVICGSASQGQTQTITREAPTTTITNAPASPKLDDGGTGFPPGDDGGGGGGGGGGGNWSGGFFLFGFLAFLGFLKDKESEEKYRDSRKIR